MKPFDISELYYIISQWFLQVNRLLLFDVSLSSNYNTIVIHIENNGHFTQYGEVAIMTRKVHECSAIHYATLVSLTSLELKYN